MSDGKVTPLRPRKRCPICSNPAEDAFVPFCSARCADIDLNRWLNGSYAIPVVENDDDRFEGTGLEDSSN